MGKYYLNFISDVDLYNHVKYTMEKYRFKMDLKAFSSNLIDPIKLTFDSKIYKKSWEEIIESEIIRQVDKSNTNHIGYFHQNIFKFIGLDWEVPKVGWDIVNPKKHIYVEMKNKHNTMNSASGQKTYMGMQSKILQEPNSICYLVEIIAKQSQDIPWRVSLNSTPISHERIRRVSIDKFYELVTGEPEAFKQLCEVLPTVMDDILKELKSEILENSVFEELQMLGSDIIKNIFLLSFKTYEGFSNFHIRK